MLFCLLQLIKPGAQDLQRFVFVFQLRLLILAGNNDSCGKMCQPHRGVCGIDALSAVSGRTEHIEFIFRRIDPHFHFIHLRHDRHSHRGGVDSSARLGLRHTLYPVGAALIFHSGIRAVSVDHKRRILESSDSVFIDAHHLRLPSAAFRIFHIHTVDFCRKQCSLVSARSRTQLNNNVPAVVRVFGQQQNLQFLLQFLHPLFRLGKLFLEHFPHFLIIFLFQHGNAVFDGLFTVFILLISVCNRLELCLLLHQLLEQPGIVCHSRLIQLIQNLFQTKQDIIQFIKHLSFSFTFMPCSLLFSRRHRVLRHCIPRLRRYFFRPTATRSSPARSLTISICSNPCRCIKARRSSPWS